MNAPPREDREVSMLIAAALLPELDHEAASTRSAFEPAAGETR